MISIIRSTRTVRTKTTTNLFKSTQITATSLLHRPPLFRPSPQNVIHLSRTYATTTTTTTKPKIQPLPNPMKSDAPLMDRLKALFRTHGWSALFIYLFLSLIDFTLTFLLIYAVGADRVREAEDWVLDKLEWRRKDGEMGSLKRKVVEWKENHGGKTVEEKIKEEKEKEREKEIQLEKKGEGYSAIATTAVLAYAIHKIALLPIRVGLTIAITPKIVRTLQSWGWKVGMNTGSTAAVAKGATEVATKSHVAP